MVEITSVLLALSVVFTGIYVVKNANTLNQIQQPLWLKLLTICCGFIGLGYLVAKFGPFNLKPYDSLLTLLLLFAVSISVGALAFYIRTVKKTGE